MKLAIYHNLPTGGALRVLDEYLKVARDRHDITLFVPDTAAALTQAEGLPLKTYAMPAATSALTRYRQAFAVSKFGRAAAKEIDEGGFDAVFAHASVITQAPEILPFVKTPRLYFAPEYLREAYDKVATSELPFKWRIKQLFFKPYNVWRKRFDRRGVHAATAVATNSEYTKGNLRRIYGVEASVVYGGVDAERFHPSEERGDFVLSVGALHPWKGHQFVIAALGTLPPEQRPALVVIGDRGDYGPELERLAQAAGVQLTVKRGISEAELAQLYATAGVVAAAQYNEPFGLVALEAMAAGTPVVAVREGGLAESVQDGVTGLATPRDPSEFGTAIAKILSDGNLAQELGTNGRQDALARWGWSRQADEFDALLSRIVG